MKCSYTKPYLHKDYLHQIIKKIIITKKTDKSTKSNMCTSFLFTRLSKKIGNRYCDLELYFIISATILIFSFGNI